MSVIALVMMMLIHYDANGFSMSPPYYHEDTGTIYTNAGYDIMNIVALVMMMLLMTFDANGFSTVTPFNHNVTELSLIVMD